DERWTVAAQAGVVLVARRLVDLRLAAELRLHRLDAQAVRLHATVAAALAAGLVDVHAHGRIRQLAALAEATLLGGTALVVHQHGDTSNSAEQALGVVESVAMPPLDAARPPRAPAVLVGLVGDHDDALCALGLEPPREVGHRPRPGRVPTPRHGHRRVVGDLGR